MHIRTRGGRAAVILAALVGLLTGCQASTGLSTSEATSRPLPPAGVAVSIPDGATEVSPRQAVNVAVTGGTLTSVDVRAADGTTVPGELNAEGTLWTAAGTVLAVRTAYTVTAQAQNADGRTTPLTSSFTTLTPRDIETAAVVPRSGQTVGIAMPIIVRFDAKVLDRAEVEQRLQVTSAPAQEGSWAWFNDREIQYRTRDHWQPGTQVTVEADMTGIEFADDVWGVDTDPTTFTVGRRQVITVDINGYQATVEQDGQIVRTMPVSNGKGRGEYATRQGHKVIMTRQRHHTMVSPGKKEGDPGYYKTPVEYAMRVTNSGEFLHAAPWSVGSQGRANVSHGCTNLSTENARWIYENSLIGDPVDFVNGYRGLNQGNGWTMWDISYEEWKQGSARPDPERP